jgi:hypothetical protein
MFFLLLLVLKHIQPVVSERRICIHTEQMQY